MNAQIYEISSKLILKNYTSAWAAFRGSRRSPFEVMADILLSSYKGQRKTRIMYSHGLSFDQLNRHLDMLTSSGLLIFKDEKYWTTGKGVLFLDTFAYMQDLLSNEQRIEQRT